MRNSGIRSSRRAAPKQDEIITEFRRQIVNGSLKPGSRLPPRRQIEAHFQAGVVTVQRAMNHLIRDGFILTGSTAGTYVAPHPPHLSRYGLVFMSRPAGWHRWTRFWTILSEQAEDIERTTPLRMPRYYMEGSLQGEDFEILLDDAESDRLAGLILTFPPHVLKGTALLQRRKLPMVAIAAEVEEGIPAVDHDHNAFISRALDYLASKGRRRIAILLPGKVHDYEDSFATGLAARGMVSHPWWTLFFSPVEMDGASSTVHLLMRPGQDERPDGVIIADDNLVEEALAGLMAAGVRIPEDADVVAHANFPCVAKTAVPLKRLGYDCREMLRTCTQIIEDIQSGKPVPPKTLIPPIFGER